MSIISQAHNGSGVMLGANVPWQVSSQASHADVIPQSIKNSYRANRFSPLYAKFWLVLFKQAPKQQEVVQCTYLDERLARSASWRKELHQEIKSEECAYISEWKCLEHICLDVRVLKGEWKLKAVKTAMVLVEGYLRIICKKGDNVLGWTLQAFINQHSKQCPLCRPYRPLA